MVQFYLPWLVLSAWILTILGCQGSPPAPSSGTARPDTADRSCDDSQLAADCEDDDFGDDDARDRSDDDDEGGSESEGDGDTNDFLQSLLGGGGLPGGDDSGLAGGDPGDGGGGGSPDEISYLTGRKAPYTSGKLNLAGESLVREKLNRSDGFFHCPGDSFLIGLNAMFEPEEEDREFRAVCQFFQTGDGRPVKKVGCKTTSKAYNRPAQVNANFSCSEGSYLAGIKGSFDDKTKDRLMQFECCEMKTWTGRGVSYAKVEKGSLGFSTCYERINVDLAQAVPDFAQFVNDEVNEIRQELTFQCQQNMMLHSVKSIFISGHQDRRYSFRCCELQVD